jgi:hypothetical protein
MKPKLNFIIFPKNSSLYAELVYDIKYGSTTFILNIFWYGEY